MFLPARWWSDKNRVKAIFKLHFHITQMLLSGVDALVLSIVPGDIGKPTMRLEKATIRDGICRWENPVYETVKFIQDPKTGKISDKMYQFLVSTGLSKASPIGEASINFADYIETSKPSSVSLSIKNSHCDAVLHVSIQRIQENSDQRDEDECEDAKLNSHGWILRNHLSNGDADESNRSYSSEDVSAKPVMNRAEMSVNCSTSSESDMTLSSSDDSSGLDSPHKLGQRKTNIHPNTNGFISGSSDTSEPQKGVFSASTSMHDDIHQRSHWDWSASSDHGLTIDDSTNGSHDAIRKERPQQESLMENERLQAELAALARQVDVSDMELQTLRKQIMKETKRGQDLTKEIIILKEERDAFKSECDNLRSFHKRMDEAKLRSRSQLESGDLRTFVEEIRQELSYEKDLNANLRLQLKKMQESNAELVLAVQDLEEMLEQKNKETCDDSNEYEGVKNSQELVVNLSRCETNYDDEQKEMEEIPTGKSNAKNTQLLEKKIIDLYGEIEMYRRDKDEFEMQIEQLALDYEILKQENHSLAYKLEQSQLQEQLKIQYECSSPTAYKNEDLEIHIENLENQLKEQSEDFSNSLATIKELKAHIRRLEEEMEKQKQGFEADVDAVTHDKVEQEQRAIRAEEALRKTRQTNAKTAERLQEEFRRLSMQMTSTFDANEKAAMRALTEASELRAQKSLMEEKLHKVKEELHSVKADYEVKLDDLSNQIETMTVQIRQMMLEIDDKTKELEDQKKLGEQASREFSEEIRSLEAENENLKGEISRLREQVEGNEHFRTDVEHMKKSVEEYETLLQRGTVERNELVTAIVLLKMEAEESLNELNTMRNLMDENQIDTRHLQSELEAVRAQCSDLKHSQSEDEAEKEKLRKQVFQLKGELKKKEDALTSMERRFKDSNGTKTITKNKKAAPIPQNSKEMASMREKVKMLQGMIKSKESELETSKTSFLEKEKELQTKIEELENKVEESNQIIALQKVVQDVIITSSNDEHEEVSGTVEGLDVTDYASEEKENKAALFSKSNENLLEKEAEELTELSSLKERNKSMESELKEMQERYLEMSLKFAEVEGERQHLVMTLRNLKGIQKA